MRKRIIVLTDRATKHKMMTNGVRVAKAFHKLGHNVMIMGHGRLDIDKIGAADMILASGTVVYARNIKEAAIIAKAKRPDAPFVLWYFDACCPEWRSGRHKHEGVCKIAPYLDWLITTDHSYPWENKVKNYMHLMQGIDPDEFKSPPSTASDNKRIDVVFTGSFKGVHAERKPFWMDIRKRHSTTAFSTDGGNAVYGWQLVSAYHKARVAYVPLPPKSIPGPYWSNRLYIAAATGIPCVVGYTEGIEDHYEEGKEVLYFRNLMQLRSCIAKLLSDTHLREQMGRAARIRTLQEHTYTNRVETLMERVFHAEKSTV